MSAFFSLAVSVLANGCHSPEIDDHAAEQVAEVRSSAARQVVYPTCYKEVTVTCGLVTARVEDAGFRERFRARYCEHRTDDDCQTRFQNMIDAELARRYYAADMNAMAVTCGLHPRECDDPKQYELYLLDSHNQHVRDEAAKNENAVEDSRARAQAEYIALQTHMWMEVAGDIHYALHRGPKCRTYPGLLSDTVTLCE